MECVAEFSVQSIGEPCKAIQLAVVAVVQRGVFKANEDRTTKNCCRCHNESEFYDPPGGPQGARGRIKRCGPDLPRQGGPRCRTLRYVHRDVNSSVAIGYLSHLEREGEARPERYVSSLMRQAGQ